MKTTASIQEYDELAGLVRSAWVHVNQAGDTPDSHRSILCLQSAMDGLLSADLALHGPSTLESTVVRYHRSFLKSQRNAHEILQALAARAQEIRRNPKAPEENVPDALLVHSAIPIIWRLVRGIRHEVRRLRPLSYYVRLVRHLAKGIGALLMVGTMLHLARFVLPWGCLVTYGSGETPDSIRGWSVARSLVKDYGAGRPLPWMRRDGWSARWQGILLVPASAEYSFFAQCQGGMRLWIDGEPLIDNWTSAGWTQGAQHAQRTLQAGPHALRMEFRDRGGHSALRVRWTGGPVPPNTEIGFPHLRKY